MVMQEAGWLGSRMLLILLTVVAGLAVPLAARADNDGDEAEESTADGSFFTPSGQRVTPLAPARARFEQFDPGVATFPDFRAGYAVSTAVSPDRRTLLVLTSGYN